MKNAATLLRREWRLKSGISVSSVPSNASRRTPAPRKLTLQEMRDWDSANPPDKVLALAPEVSANAADTSPPNNPSFHWKGRATDEGTLWTYSTLATRARTAGRQQRRALRFPALRPVYAKERRDLNGFVVRKAKSYRGDVWAYLTNWGYRTLNDLDGAGFAPPSHADLADLFERRVRERGVTFYPLYSNRGRGISTPDVETMADQAATAVLRDWHPEWIREQRERGRRGGQISKRKPSWTDDDLDALAKMSHLPNMQARADALGRSLRTTERMWSALQQRQI